MEKYKILNQDREHEFTMLISKNNVGTEYRLKRSNSERWTKPGELVLAAFDSGDGVTLDTERYSRSLSYHKLQEVSIMFNFIRRYNGDCKFRAVREQTYLKGL
jgi:hypothetical protein